MYFNYNSLKIYYEKTNLENTKNTPILFLHGWGGNVNSLNFFANNLKNDVECIFLDFPPFGKSSMLTKPFDVEDYSKIVLKLLNILKIKRVNIVAHSFGGRVALHLASHNKKRINKMLLTGCAGLKRKEIKIKLKILAYKFKKFLSKLKLYPKNKLSKSGSEDYKNLNPVMKKTFNKIVNYDERFLLKDINAETLFVWGKLDKETPFYFTKIFKKHIKNSEVIVFSKCGHFAYLEKPDLFLLILKSFFEI